MSGRGKLQEKKTKSSVELNIGIPWKTLVHSGWVTSFLRQAGHQVTQDGSPVHSVRVTSLLRVGHQFTPGRSPV